MQAITTLDSKSNGLKETARPLDLLSEGRNQDAIYVKCIAVIYAASVCKALISEPSNHSMATVSSSCQKKVGGEVYLQGSTLMWPSTGGRGKGLLLPHVSGTHPLGSMQEPFPPLPNAPAKHFKRKETFTSHLFHWLPK